METRKEPMEIEENAKKRRRIDEESGAPSERAPRAVSFEDLNSDCLVYILSYLEVEGMNTVAMCNKGWREARSNESLNQTRTGTIVCSEKNTTTVRTIHNAIVENGWNKDFTGNRTRLKIAGIERLQNYNVLYPLGLTPPELTGVTSLDLSTMSEDPHHGCAKELFELCPNVKNLNLNGVKVRPLLNDCVWYYCRRLKQMTWKGARQTLDLGDDRTPKNTSVTEIYMDDSEFCTLDSSRLTAISAYGSNDSQKYLFSMCPNLERVSVKNATLCSYTRIPDRFSYRLQQSEALPQELLIKFVRRHQALRWLRCDLTDENVVMLKKERPEVTFVLE